MNQRWLGSRELEAIMLGLEQMAQRMGLDKQAAREVAYSAVKDAKAQFDRQVAEGSPDAGRIKG